METFIQDAGVFIYPLGLCSVLSLVVFLERWVALRGSAVIPGYLWRGILTGGEPTLREGDRSVLAEVVRFRAQGADEDSLKAFLQWHQTRLERGLFLLDLVVGAAPLIGLLGTVTGLVRVFAGFDLSEAFPQTEAFVQGIALALSTTVIGLAIAIPTLVASSWLYRRVDTLGARLRLATEEIARVERREKE